MKERGGILRLRERSVGEILVLMIAGTVCFSVLASGALVAVLSFFRPETDVTLWVTRVTSIVNTLIGLLAGFLAGRTEAEQHAKDLKELRAEIAQAKHERVRLHEQLSQRDKPQDQP